MFQIHLWSGIGIGIYVVLISISGSVLVFRNELFNLFTAKPVVVEARGARLTEDQLRDKAVQTYPGYDVSQFFEKKKKPNEVLTAKEVRDELRKALKYKPAIYKYIIVTTAPKDRKLE